MSRAPSACAMVAALALSGAAFAADMPAPAYSVVARISGPDGGWDLLDVASSAHRLYVARTSGVMAVDLGTLAVTPALLATQRGHSAMPIPGTTRVIATDGAANTATVFEGATGRVVATLKVGTKPDAVAWDPATRTVWVMNADSGDISVIDPAGLKVIATVAVGGSLELGAADGAGRLYVNIEDQNAVAVIDTRARKVLARYPLAGCEEPTGIAYARDVKRILSACANGVAKVTATDGRDLATLTIGPRPDGALYDQDRHLAFVPSGGDGTLAEISLTGTPRVLATIPTARGARTAALEPATGRIYLPSAAYLPAVGSARPQAIPGTFAVLVVAPGAR